MRINSADACARIIEKIPAKGAFRHDSITPLVGDNVNVSSDGGYMITSVLPRKNSLIRPPVANIDALFIVISAACPDPVEGFADKLTVICEKNEIVPVVIVTKRELARDTADGIAREYAACGYDSFSISAAENTGVDTLREYIALKLRGKTAAFAGASGVGKSTLCNALYPTLGLKVGELSEKIERGKNTTRRVSLLETGDGAFIADTPGFGMLDFEHFDFCDKDELPFLFPEFVPLLGSCRYTKCSHAKEDGCAIRRAAEEGRVSPSRYASYLSLRDDVKDKKEWK